MLCLQLFQLSLSGQKKGFLTKWFLKSVQLTKNNSVPSAFLQLQCSMCAEEASLT